MTRIYLCCTPLILLCIFFATLEAQTAAPTPSCIVERPLNEPVRIVYPRPMRELDTESWYPLRLLKQSLSAAGVSFELFPSEDMMVQSRSIRALEQGRDINLMWTMTTAEREQQLRPIKIPLYRGLYGWRLLLTSTESAAVLQRSVNHHDLSQLIFVQGHDWPDTAILQANDLMVVTSTQIDMLFDMLIRQRAHAFPRSVLEIWWEQQQYPELRVENKLALHYPTAVYFFVNQDDVALASLIECGLEIMIEQGTMQQLFWEVHADYIQKANLGQRALFQLRNPFLPENTPLHRPELWFKPSP